LNEEEDNIREIAIAMAMRGDFDYVVKFMIEYQRKKDPNYLIRVD